MAIFDGIDLNVSNTDKIMFPRDGLTKGDVIAHYAAIAGYMLPHMKGRPVTMVRYPDGIDGESFYQKEVSGRFPTWFHTIQVEKKGGHVVHAVCQKTADLVYLANINCVTPHVWLSREGSLDRPDRMILDMDPADDDFGTVKDAARLARVMLRELGLEPFVMTTGSRGLHVTVPLDRTSGSEAVMALAKEVATRMMEADERFTMERSKGSRGDRLLVDVFRNSYAQTGVAPYALRAKDGAPVATPLEWGELDDARLGPQSFRWGNIRARLRERGDPWANIEESAGSALEALTRSRR
ncbi:MAG: non-homologous end-joining DNA ligase [Methanomassiliicoccus sp.]|nr:non-homologous end-joining DNA ligase [Methanomassiliicoccus sp.]